MQWGKKENSLSFESKSVPIFKKQKNTTYMQYCIKKLSYKERDCILLEAALFHIFQTLMEEMLLGCGLVAMVDI